MAGMKHLIRFETASSVVIKCDVLALHHLPRCWKSAGRSVAGMASIGSWPCKTGGYRDFGKKWPGWTFTGISRFATRECFVIRCGLRSNSPVPW
jgi:hypothetical protein